MTTHREHRMSARRPRSRGPFPAAAIRADVRLTSGDGFTRYFSAWTEVAEWLGSPGYLAKSGTVSSVRLVHSAAQPGGGAGTS